MRAESTTFFLRRPNELLQNTSVASWGVLKRTALLEEIYQNPVMSGRNSWILENHRDVGENVIGVRVEPHHRGENFRYQA